VNTVHKGDNVVAAIIIICKLVFGRKLVRNSADTPSLLTEVSLCTSHSPGK
jgi:hypothetical protein